MVFKEHVWFVESSFFVFASQVLVFKDSDLVADDRSNTFQLIVKQEEPTMVPPAEETEKGLYPLEP